MFPRARRRVLPGQGARTARQRLGTTEIAPDKLTFYLREGQTSATFEYELQARFAGTYKVLPPRVFGASRPDLVAYGEPAGAPDRGGDGLRGAVRL